MRRKGEKAANVKFSGIRTEASRQNSDKFSAVEDPANDEAVDEWLDNPLEPAPPRLDKFLAIQTPVNFSSKRVVSMLTDSESDAQDNGDNKLRSVSSTDIPGDDDDYTIDFD